MSVELILLCNLEHLRPYDSDTGTDREWAFGMNVAMAFGRNTPTDGNLDYLKPWLWPAIQSLKIFVDDSVQSTPLTWLGVRWGNTFSNREINATNFPDQFTHVRQLLETQFQRCEQTPDPSFVWDPGANPISEKSVLTQRSVRRWHALLGEVSNYPPPLAHVVNLSFLFRVRKLENALPKLAFAAPLIPPSSLFPSGLTPVEARPTMWTDHPGIYRWAYQTEIKPGLPLTAYMVPCRIREAPSTSTFIDLNTQWVKRLGSNCAPGTGPVDHFDEDWRVLLEKRMADSFDLPQRIIEFLRTQIDNQAFVSELPLMRRMVFASLRDITGPGLFKPPNGQALINRVLSANNAPLISEDTFRQARVFLEGQHQEITAWISFLKISVPKVRQLSITGDDDAANLGIATYVSELDQLYQLVLDPANLYRVVLAQWVTANHILRIANIERLSFEGIDLRGSLAMENLGRFWPSFIKSNSSPGNDGGQSLIAVNYSRFLQAYYCLRFEVTSSILADPVLRDLVARYATQYPRVMLNTHEQTIAAVLIPSIAAWGNSFAGQLLPASSERPVPTDVPHAITLQIDTINSLPEEAPDPDSKDLLKSISGVCVLMREKPTDPTTGDGWRCLNMANPILAGTASTLTSPLVSPLRIHYHNQLRQALITYNNHPLSAKSPVSKMSEITLVPTTTGSAEEPPLIEYEYSTHDSAKLPALKFGKVYQILPFVVSNNGALPRALVDNAPLYMNLANFSSTTLPTEIQCQVREINYLRKVRIGSIRVLDEEGKATIKFPVIPDSVHPRAREIRIPRAPIPPSPTPTPVPSACGPTSQAVQERDEEPPLLLLCPSSWERESKDARSEYSFTIKKPATDINTWDRWLANPDNLSMNETIARKLRADIWADFYRKSEDNRKGKTTLEIKNEPNANAVDVSIDEPSLADNFYVELWRFNGTTRELLDSALLRNVPATMINTGNVDPCTSSSQDPANSISAVQAHSLRVNCSFITRNNTEPWLTPVIKSGTSYHSDLNVKVKEGEVYSLVTYACLPRIFMGRFADVITKEERPNNPAVRDFWLVSPFTLLIECATDVLIEVDEAERKRKLWESLRPTFSPPGDDGSIVVTLRPTSPLIPTGGFRHIHRAELMRQVWRWQGRLTALHPLLKSDVRRIYEKPVGQRTASEAARLKEEIDKWEAREFGNRWNTDHLRIDFGSDPPTPEGYRNFTYKEVLEGARIDRSQSFCQAGNSYTYDQVVQGVGGVDRAGTFRQGNQTFTYAEIVAGRKDVVNELRALHYRFGVQVFSRYEGIMPHDKSSMIGVENDKSGRIWKWEFVPCRTRENIPTPKVKLILPLTESYGSENPNAHSGGLMLVLDEPWYETGGLGEGLRAEVVTVDGPEDAPKTYFELGGDPIISDVVGGLNSSTTAVCLGENLTGPVGHTFDRTNDAPLLSTTSFLIPAPKVNNTVPNAAWDFCKLRLQRTIDLLRPEIDSACGTPFSGTRLLSDFTSPIWVQYLPEFSRFEGEYWSNLATLRLRLISDQQIQFVDPNGRTVPQMNSDATGVFQHYLVVTKRVFDATGRNDQELYLAVFRRGSDINVWISDQSLQGITESLLRARVIEVQRRPVPANGNPRPFINEEQLWKAIFDEDVRDVDRARITRISDPIDAWNGVNPC